MPVCRYVGMIVGMCVRMAGCKPGCMPVHMHGCTPGCRPCPRDEPVCGWMYGSLQAPAWMRVSMYVCVYDSRSVCMWLHQRIMPISFDVHLPVCMHVGWNDCVCDCVRVYACRTICRDCMLRRMYACVHICIHHNACIIVSVHA